MYLNNWDSEEEMKKDFEITAADLEGAEVLLASYGTPSYEGYAFVLFERAGKLYEVNGSHCSCYGLEGQWIPEETRKEALLERMDKGTLGNGEEGPFADELRALLSVR